jgi:hypothetical protein
MEKKQAILTCLISHLKAIVYWDRSDENCKKCADLTSQFIDLPNVVAFIDGKKLTSLHLKMKMKMLQNRDLNGWTSDVHHGLVLVWDPCGIIVNAATNLPGNFHDSKRSKYGNLYWHIESLKDSFVIVADSAFQATGDLDGKIKKIG